jgi:hypothetical protein
MRFLLISVYFISISGFSQALTGKYNDCVKSNLIPGFTRELEINENGKFFYNLSGDVSVLNYSTGTWKQKGNFIYFKKVKEEKILCKGYGVIGVVKGYDSALNGSEIRISPYSIEELDTVSMVGAILTFNDTQYIVENQSVIGNQVSSPLNIKIIWLQEITYTLKYSPRYNEFKVFVCYGNLSTPQMKKPPYKKLLYSSGKLLDKNGKCIFSLQ